jgi:hypothetical protein
LFQAVEETTEEETMSATPRYFRVRVEYYLRSDGGIWCALDALADKCNHASISADSADFAAGGEITRAPGAGPIENYEVYAYDVLESSEINERGEDIPNQDDVAG